MDSAAEELAHVDHEIKVVQIELDDAQFINDDFTRKIGAMEIDESEDVKNNLKRKLPDTQGFAKNELILLSSLRMTLLFEKQLICIVAIIVDKEPLKYMEK